MANSDIPACRCLRGSTQRRARCTRLSLERLLLLRVVVVRVVPVHLGDVTLPVPVSVSVVRHRMKIRRVMGRFLSEAESWD